MDPRKRAQRVTRILLLLFVIGMMPQPSVAEEHAYRAAVSIYFSPDGGCSEAIVQALRTARQRILVQAYTFTSAPIAQALIEAHTRGVAVQVLLDKSNVTAQYSSVTFLRHVGIPVAIDSQHAIAHNKIIIIDDTTVLTGSFNFTKAACKFECKSVPGNRSGVGKKLSEKVYQFTRCVLGSVGCTSAQRKDVYSGLVRESTAGSGGRWAKRTGGCPEFWDPSQDCP